MKKILVLGMTMIMILMSTACGASTNNQSGNTADTTADITIDSAASVETESANSQIETEVVKTDAVEEDLYDLCVNRVVKDLENKESNSLNLVTDENKEFFEIALVTQIKDVYNNVFEADKYETVDLAWRGDFDNDAFDASADLALAISIIVHSPKHEVTAEQYEELISTIEKQPTKFLEDCIVAAENN